MIDSFIYKDKKKIDTNSEMLIESTPDLREKTRSW